MMCFSYITGTAVIYSEHSRLQRLGLGNSSISLALFVELVPVAKSSSLFNKAQN